MVAAPGTARNSIGGCNRSRTDWFALSTNRFLAFVLVAEETMPRRELAAATSLEVIAAKVSAHLTATAYAGAGKG
jgi:hypothetical protein